MSRLLSMLVAVGLVPTLALGAGPVFWDWPTDRPFAELDLVGAAVDANGHLTAGLTAKVFGSEGPDGPEVFWQTVADGQGGYYVGTGHGGQVLHTTADGGSELLASLEGTEIFALLRLPDGDLLAGVGPEGLLYRINPDGAARVVGTVPGGYIWALAQASPQEPVWVATGSPAGLYRFDPASDTLTEELELPAQNTLAVRPLSGKTVLLATQGPGLIYRHEAGQPLQLLHETAQDEARQFISGPEGDVFLLALHTAAESGNGLLVRADTSQPATPPALLPMPGQRDEPEVPAAALYRLDRSGRVETWWSGADALMAAVWSPRWGWLAGGPLGEKAGMAELKSLTPPSGAQVLARWQGGDVLDLQVSGQAGEQVIVSQAQPGSLVILGDDQRHPPLALSPPLDGGAPVAWGRLAWQGQGEGSAGNLRWSVRGGNRSQPDETWSDWSKPWSESDHALEMEPCRYLQWRVEFPAGRQPDRRWQVTSVAVSAWQENLAPVVTAFQLEHLMEMSFGGLMNGNENVTQRFRSGLMAEYSRNAAADDWVGPARSAFVRSLRVFTWQGTDPNGDRLVYRLEYRRLGAEAWRPVSAQRPGEHETGETLASWDTAEVPDGQYEMRLTASDRRDNPAHLAREAQHFFGPVAVDNTAPVVRDFKLRATAAGFTVEGRVEDGASVLAGARLVLPDGTTERLDPVDRICDSRRETFKAEIVWPRPGIEAGPKPWSVRLEAQDLGGNLGSEAGEVP